MTKRHLRETRIGEPAGSVLGTSETTSSEASAFVTRVSPPAQKLLTLYSKVILVFSF